MNDFNQYQFIDTHYHASPDLYLRHLNALEAGRAYQALGGAVVLKSHLGATCVQATLAQDQGLPVFPSLVLNAVAGGIHYRVIQHALAEFQPTFPAKLIVYFPTITGRKMKSRLTRQLADESLSASTLASETIFNDANQLRSEVIDIIKMANGYPIVLSTGHASKEETLALIEACDQYSVSALLLNQPANPLTGLSAQELKALAHFDFLWFEQTALTYLLKHQSEADFIEVLTSVPRVIYSSDLGQTSQMNVKSWHDFSINLFTKLSLSAQRIDEIWRNNASQIL